MNNLKALIQACVLIILTVSAPSQATENNDKTNAEPIFVPIYNPNTGKVEYRTCSNYPDCSQEGEPPAANLEDEQ